MACLVARCGLHDPPPSSILDIDRYTVREELGRGGFGTVYRCYDHVLMHDVAIKVPHAQRVCSAEDVDAFSMKLVAGFASTIPALPVSSTPTAKRFLLPGHQIYPRLESGRTHAAIASVCRRVRQDCCGGGQSSALRARARAVPSRCQAVEYSSRCERSTIPD